MKKLFALFMALCVSVASADTFTAGGDRLLDLQNTDGGWDWPLDNGNPDTGSAKNTAAPIGMGLLEVYKQTGDSDYLDGAVEAGDFIKAVSPPHSTGNGIFMSELSKVTGDSSYADKVKTEFYGALNSSSYDKDGTLYSTSTYATYINNLRSGQHSSTSGISYTDLAVWDVGLAAAGAAKLGCDQSVLDDWSVAVDSSLELWKADYSDSLYSVLGLAGGVYGLASLGQETLDFELGSDLYGISDINQLADLLASYQTESGGFSMYSQYVSATYTGVQETAYAILALSAVDAELYSSEIYMASNWLMNSQLSNGGWAGGWEGIDPSRENNEVTGEALWATSVAVPAPGAVLLAGLGTACVGRFRRRMM